jgi:hypothetical protein
VRVTRIMTFVLLAATFAAAQASRTWVSGVGDDANPCSRTAPCKTFAGAISKTAAGGEIDALDPAGYGAVTITKGITIDGGGGQVASVLVSGTNGIVVQAGPSDVVILRNLRINGIGTGINGIRFLSGKDLNVENCVIFGFTTNGVDIALNQATQASAHVVNTIIKNNGGDGVRATNAVTPAVLVGIDNSQIMLNNIGIEAATNAKITASRNFVARSASAGLFANGGGLVTFDDGFVVNGNNGATTSTGGSVISSTSTFALNTGTAYNGTNNFVLSSGCSACNSTNSTNRAHDNGSLGTPTFVPQD